MTPSFRHSRRAVTPLEASRTRLALEPLEERAVPTIFTVTNLNDGGAGSLRQAITAANVADDADVIRFAAGLSGTINLTIPGADDANAGGDLDILKPVSIEGPGANVLTVKQTAFGERVFDVQPAAGVAVAISGLTITGGNTLFDGGGVQLLTGAALTLSAVEITGNTSGGNGGGISQGILSGSVMTIINSTIANNSAGDSNSLGGGICILSGSATIINSTISGNSAGVGGGVRAGAGAVTIRNCTITGNTASLRVAGISQGGSETLTLSSTIVAGNTAPGAQEIEDAVQPASDHNLIGNDIGLMGISNGMNGNLIGTAANPINPMLGPLQFNGGPTRTHAPLPGSLAINHGSDLIGLASDQRGLPFLRHFGAGVDIGAFETQPALQPTAQALQAAIQTLQSVGGRLAAFAFGDMNGDFINDIVLAVRLRNNKLVIVTFDGVSGKIIGAFQPFRNVVGANSRLQLLTLNLNADPLPEIGLIVTLGGPGVPHISGFTVTGMRLF
jgi:hypothetical protein